MTPIGVVAAETVRAQGVLDWYEDSIQQLKDVTDETLLVVIFFGVAITWIRTRSWSKTIAAALAGVFVYFMLMSRDVVQDMLKDDLDSSPANRPPAVVRHVDEFHNIQI